MRLICVHCNATIGHTAEPPESLLGSGAPAATISLVVEPHLCSDKD